MNREELEAMQAALDFCNAVDICEQTPRELCVRSGEVRRKIMVVLRASGSTLEADVAA